MERVYYASIDSPVGPIWAAATDAGLLQVHLRWSEDALLSAIKRRIDAQIIHDPGRFKELRELLEAYFNGERVAFDLPLDLRGTEFQKAIWQAIHKIPYGKLSSYGRLAAAVGRPRAVRAAGNAVGANPLAIVIPCHRVIRSDGSLGGFGGGLDLKRYLLSIEGVLPPPGRRDLQPLEREYPRTRKDLLRYFFE